MTIHEPMTLATDYLLTIAATIFGARLWRVERWWAVAFFATALASFAGGTFHGFQHAMPPAAASALWKTVIYAVGVGSFALLTGAILATTRGRVRGALIFLAALQFVVYAAAMVTRDDFGFVIVDYGVSLLAVGVLQAIAWFRHRAPSARWVWSSIAVSAIAAGVQGSGFTLHRHFNHNDLYHVIQLLALWLLFRGGLLLSQSRRG